MNTETGEITSGLTELKMKAKGLVPVSEHVADAVEIGREALNRAGRRLREREQTRSQRRARRRHLHSS